MNELNQFQHTLLVLSPFILVAISLLLMSVAKSKRGEGHDRKIDPCEDVIRGMDRVESLCDKYIVPIHGKSVEAWPLQLKQAYIGAHWAWERALEGDEDMKEEIMTMGMVIALIKDWAQNNQSHVLFIAKDDDEWGTFE